MAIPLSVLVYESGANGVPQVAGRADNLRGKIATWEHSIVDRYGFEGARCSWSATPAEALDWARPDHLMRACEVFNPSGGRVWEGFLSEIEVTIGRVKLCLSIKDMANRLTVRYSAPDAGSSSSAVYSSASSIAMYGTRDRLLTLSTASPTGAANRAQTALTQIAFPKSRQPSEGGTSAAGDCTIALKFMGWYEVLGWIVTASTSTTTTSASTQLTTLLAAYAAINAFLSTDTSQIQSGLPSETEWIDPDTSYREKIDSLLALGDSSHARLHWGVFDDRALLVRTWAGATPSTIGYYESSRTGRVTDAYGNAIDPWDLRPDVMCQVVDVLDTDSPEGAIESATRKYVARVTCRVSSSGVGYTLEPEDVESLESLLSSPAGSGPAGTSDRQAKIERITTAVVRTRFPALDNTIRYNGATGVLLPAAGGTGKVNTGTIDTQGGNIVNTGGGPIDLGTGSGIGGSGSSGVTTSGSGTVGALVKWATTTTLADAVAGTDYAAASHTHAASAIISGVLGTARLGSGTANSTTFLRGDSTWQAITTITPSTIGAAPDSAKYIVQQADGGLSNEQALGALATGILKNTTTTGVLSIAVSGTDYLDGSGTSGRLAQWGASNALADSTLIKSGSGVLTLSAGSTATLTIDSSTRLDGTGAASGEALVWNGTAYAPSAVPSGSGTTGRIAQWSSSSALQAATLIKSGSGVLTLSAGSAYTLTIPATGTAALGTGVAGKLAYWLSANEVQEATGAAYDSGADRVTVSAITTTSLRCDTNGTFDKININSSAAPTHSLQLTSTDDAAKSTTSTWTVTSDARSKTIDGPYTRSLAFLQSLPAVMRYEHNGKFGTVAGMRSMNFIAQEIEQVAPEWITRDIHVDNDGTETEVLRLNSHEHIFALHNAILSLAERMDRHGL